MTPFSVINADGWKASSPFCSISSHAAHTYRALVHNQALNTSMKTEFLKSQTLNITARSERRLASTPRVLGDADRKGGEHSIPFLSTNVSCASMSSIRVDKQRDVRAGFQKGASRFLVVFLSCVACERQSGWKRRGKWVSNWALLNGMLWVGWRASLSTSVFRIDIR